MKRTLLFDRWTLLWAGFVAVISLMPQAFKMRLGTSGIFHGWAHLVVFAVTAILVCRKDAPLTSQVWRALAVIAFAAVIEYLQHAFYGNSFEWRDMTIDAAGALLGLVFSLIAPIRVSGKPAPR